MSAQERGDNPMLPREQYYEAAMIAGLPPEHPAVDFFVRLVDQNSYLHGRVQKLDNLVVELKARLEIAEKDPLTGFWLPGPGISKLEHLMSTIENNLAGLGEDKESAPNALLAIGLDVEGLHYTNNWYGQKGGNARLILAGQELRETAEIIKQSARTHDRRSAARDDEPSREPDLLIRTGGDEFLAAMAFHETEDNTKEMMAERITQRLSRHKIENVPNLRLLYRIGFFIPGIGQTAEDLYHSADPKAEMTRRQRLARPIVKVVRLGFGQYKPPLAGKL